ncbi:MAG: hypothetical protein ACOYK7_12625, partial [Pirellulales bacterium]
MSAGFTSSFTIDKTGPRVTAASPAGTVAAAVDHFDVTFTEELGRLLASDIAVTGPGGAVTVGTPKLLAGTTWRIPVSGVALNGTYTVSSGTGTTDLAGNGLDQDGDGTPNAFSGSFTLALPDLVVEDLSSPATAAAGQTVAVSWTTRNAGAAAGVLATTEEVWLSDDATIGNDRFLGSFSFADLGRRIVNVTIPAYGPASGGAVRLVVKTAAAGWTELDTADNAAISPTPIDIPLGLTLSLAASQVAETGQPVTATVRRNGPTTQDLVVALASGDVTEATVPASVTIPAGQSAVTFLVTPVADGITDGPQPVTLSATATGFGAGAAALTVIDVDLPRLSISGAPGELVEGRAGMATITRSVVTDQPLVVTFASAVTQQIATPATVVIPANQASATFTIATVNNAIPEPAEAVALIASAAGHDPASVTVTVVDDDLPTLALELDRTTLEEGTDGPARAIVRRAVATSQPLTVRIIVGNPARLLAPETIEIPANQTAAAFWLLAVDDVLANGPADVSVTVAGVYPLTGGTIPTGQATGTITVRDDDGPQVTVSLDRTVVREGLAAAANGRVTRSGSTAGAIVVSLASSDTSEATVPATVTIPDGAASATFVVTSVADTLTDGSQPVVISATATGLRTGSATLLVTDAELPDLVLRDLAVPATAFTESLETVSWRVYNLGTGRAAGTMTQQVWLSRDAVPGNDQLIGNYPFTGVLDHAGEFNWFGQSVPVRMPVEVGPWWIIVTADALETVTEGFEANNTVVAVTPISVVPAYSATVQTALDVAPAGTPVVFTGEALQTGSGSRAPFVPVNVTLTVRGVTRTLLAVTDAAGAFRITFTPLPGEAGNYTVAAHHPGAAAGTAQDSFTLLGMKAAPATPGLGLVAGGAEETLAVTLTNLADVPLNGLVASVIESSPGVTAAASLASGTLAGLGNVALVVRVQAAVGTAAAGRVVVRITSAEGATLDVPVALAVEALTPRIVLDRPELAAGLPRGEQRFVEFTITNAGGAATGPVEIRLPDVPWIRSATGPRIDDIAPGATARVVLQLTPPADLALGEYRGSIGLVAARSSATLPFRFRGTSAATGDLALVVVDEFTLYAEGAPRVAGATVTILDALTQQPVGSGGTTDAEGRFSAASLAEGMYVVQVS